MRNVQRLIALEVICRQLYRLATHEILNLPSILLSALCEVALALVARRLLTPLALKLSQCLQAQPPAMCERSVKQALEGLKQVLAVAAAMLVNVPDIVNDRHS